MDAQTESIEQFETSISRVETTIAAIEANRALLGDLVADTALDLLRERLATLIQPQQAADERKRVTVLFADVAGYTALSENLDPEDVATIMNRLFTAVTAEIHRYGGTVDKYAGDAVMALFGAPQALENHEEMAVRAALAMQQVICTFSKDLEQERGFAISMRIGLNTGEVLAGLVGGLRARSYTVMGDTVNLSARLESAAPIGRIMISATTAAPLPAIFDFEPPQQITVKGKSEPITVYLVVGEKADRGRVRGIGGLHAPMVGREAEFAQLRELFDGVIAAREWRAAAILGDAGIGKSRLQREFVAWVNEAHPQTRVLSARCYTHTRTTPYYFVAGLLRALLRIGADVPAETAVAHLTAELQTLHSAADEQELSLQISSLGSVLGMPVPDDLLRNLDPEQRRDRTFLSLERIFLAAAAQTPLLFMIDDFHWADALSIDFLTRMLNLVGHEAVQGHPAFFYIVSRPPESSTAPFAQTIALLRRPPHTTLTLQRLDPSQSEALIAALLDQAMPADLLELINEHALGNPFFVEEILRTFIEDGTLEQDENHRWQLTQMVADVEIPSSVQDIIAARLDRLPPANKRITQHAAIIGRIFWQELLTRVAEIPSAEPTLLLLEMRQLAERVGQSQIAEDWEWVFHHVLIQEVAYAMVPRSGRRQVHQLVARALEEQLHEQTRFLLPLIAYHFERGAEPEKAIHYLQLAGEQAAAQFANQDAVGYFSRALQLLGGLVEGRPLQPHELAQQFHLLRGRADVYHLSAKRESQLADLQALQQLADKLDQYGKRADVARRFADYYHAVSDFPAAVAAAREVVGWAELGENGAQKVEGLNAWAFGLLRQGEFDAAYQHARLARRLAAQEHNEDGVAASLVYLGIVDYFRGDLAPARDNFLQSLAIARRRHDLNRQTTCLTNLVGIFHGLGDLAEAKSTCEEALSIARLTGDRGKEATILNNLGAMQHALGDLDMARLHHGEALLLSQSLGNRLGESLAANNLSLVLHDLGEAEKAAHYADFALQIDREIGDKRGEGYSLTALATAYTALRRLDEAQQAHEAAMALREKIGQEAVAVDNYAGLAYIAYLREDWPRAQGRIGQALDWIAGNGHAGVEYPLRVLLTAYQIYTAVAQPAPAARALADAEALLAEQAAKISDTETRAAFVERVPIHQELRRLLGGTEPV